MVQAMRWRFPACLAACLTRGGWPGQVVNIW